MEMRVFVVTQFDLKWFVSPKRGINIDPRLERTSESTSVHEECVCVGGWGGPEQG